MKRVRMHIRFHEEGVTITSQDELDITWTFKQEFPEAQPEQVVRSYGLGSQFSLKMPLQRPATELAKNDSQFSLNIITLPSGSICSPDRYE